MLVGWQAEGFVAHRQAGDDPHPTFRANGPGSASITVTWTDATGRHDATFAYQVNGGAPN